MDAATLRRALYDLIKFDTRDFFVGGSGTSFLVRLARRQGNAAVPVPLEPVATTKGEDQALFVTDGTFGGNSLASGASATPTIEVDGEPVPISETGEDRPKLILAGGEKCVYLVVTVDDEKKIVTVTVEASTEPDPPENTDTIAYVKIGTLSFSDSGVVKVARILGGSQVYKWCGGHTYCLI